MSDRRCRCGAQGGKGCEDGHAAFWASVERKTEKMLADARERYRRRHAWATGGGGGDLIAIGEDLAGVIELIHDKRGY